MSTNIKLKRSSVQGKVPTTTDLELGELAVNTYDGKLYMKKDDGTESIVDITSGGASVPTLNAVTSAGNTTNTNILFSDNKILGRDTTDASDNGYIAVVGGGAESDGRGAIIRYYGNEHSTNAGELSLASGNVTGGKISMRAGGTSDVVTVTSSGVGINDSNPLDRLSVAYNATAVYSPSSIPPGMRLTNHTTANTADQAVGIQFQATSLSGTTTGVAGISAVQYNKASSADLVFQNRNAGTISETMRINYQGNVGIGTSSPASNLDVVGSTGIYQRHSSGGSLVFDDSDTADASTPMSYIRNTAGALQFGHSNRNASTGLTTNSAESMRIDSSGNVGIGTSSPSSKLDVNGTVTATAFSGPLTGNVTGTATSADKWTTSRTVTFATGDVTGSFSIDGSADVSNVALTIAANSVALGTDTTGNYVATISGTANEIEVSGSGSESAAVTIGLPDSVSITSNLTVGGNLTINGTTTTVNATTVTLDDPIITLGGDTAPSSNDSKDRGIEFHWHNGTAAKVGFFGYDNSTGYLTFIPDATNTSEAFSGTLGDIQATNFRGGLIAGDNVKAIFGAGSDLQIYHNGTHSFITDAGTGDLKILGANIEIGNVSAVLNFKGVSGGASTVYYNGSGKLTTTNTGIDVTGTGNFSDILSVKPGGHTATAADDWEKTADLGYVDFYSHTYGGSGWHKWYGANWTNWHYLASGSSGGEVVTHRFKSTGSGTDSSIEIYDGSAWNKVVTTAGDTMTGDLDFGDNVKATFGASSDLQIYHDGSNSFIQDAGTGDLIIRASNTLYLQSYSGAENYLTASTNGAVTLYYDNAAKLATTNTGIDVTGTVTADGLTVDASGDIRLQFSYSRVADADNGGGWAGGYNAYVDVSTVKHDSTGSLSAIHYNNTGVNVFTDESAVAGTAAKKRALFATNGDISFYDDTGTTPKFFWDASAEQLQLGTLNNSVNPAVLAIKSDANGHALTIEEPAGAGETWQIGVDADGDLGFYNSTSTTASITFDDSGNVGIGTSSPAYTLDVNGNAQINGRALIEKLRFSGGDSGNLEEASFFRWNKPDFATNTNIWYKMATITIGTGAYAALSMEMKVTMNEGNFGNVVDVESSLFHMTFYRSAGTQDDQDTAIIKGKNPGSIQFRIYKTSTGVYELQTLSTANYKGFVADILVTGTNGGSFSIVESATTLGTTSGGTEYTAATSSSEYHPQVNLPRVTAPWAQIVDGSGGNGDLFVERTSGATFNAQAQASAAVIGTTTDHNLQLKTNGSVRMTIENGGNVGIGTTTPGYKLEVNGSFAATTKSFVIDHPTKEGMKLRHGSLEGPENGVYVRGRLKENNIIELPDYWTGLVHEDSITVNLTAIGGQQDLWVEDIKDNKVYVGSDGRPINCFYVVYGTRKDIEQFDVEYS